MYALGDWQLSGIVQAQSGSPLTVLAGKDLSGSALGADRGVCNAAMNSYGISACGTLRHCVNYMNVAAFSLPAQGTIGTASKGQFRGPHYVNLDASLFKEMPLGSERLKLQFVPSSSMSLITIIWPTPASTSQPPMRVAYVPV
jgi:hypothetical protein